MKITLCGSTKFMEEFNKANLYLTLSGHIVYSVATTVHGELEVTDEEKDLLDLVHFSKILNSDIIVVLNVDGYIGYSTNREIMWARMQDKPIYYLEANMIQNPMIELISSSALTGYVNE